LRGQNVDGKIPAKILKVAGCYRICLEVFPDKIRGMSQEESNKEVGWTDQRTLKFAQLWPHFWLIPCWFLLLCSCSLLLGDSNSLENFLQSLGRSLIGCSPPMVRPRSTTLASALGRQFDNVFSTFGTQYARQCSRITEDEPYISIIPQHWSQKLLGVW
jgi:hypothetical protein